MPAHGHFFQSAPSPRPFSLCNIFFFSPQKRSMSIRVFLAVVITALAARGTAAGRVQVDLFGEAGCPYCAHFTVADVAPLFENGLSELMDFRYVAWGNARNNTTPVSSAALERHRTILRLETGQAQREGSFYFGLEGLKAFPETRSGLRALSLRGSWLCLT